MSTPAVRPEAGLALVVFAAAALLCASYLAAPWVAFEPGAGLIAWKASGIALFAVFALACSRPGLAAALGLSAVGDVLLELGPDLMTAGIAAFAAAHLAYIAILARRIGADGWWRAALPAAAVVIAFALAMLVWLGPSMGALRLPVSLYIGIIAAMACLALLARAPALVALGALLFLASDSLLALGLFKDGAGLGPTLRHITVWGTYAGAQACLSWGLTRRA